MSYVDWFLLAVIVPPLGEFLGSYWGQLFREVAAEIKAGIGRFRSRQEG